MWQPQAPSPTYDDTSCICITHDEGAAGVVDNTRCKRRVMVPEQVQTQRAADGVRKHTCRPRRCSSESWSGLTNAIRPGSRAGKLVPERSCPLLSARMSRPVALHAASFTATSRSRASFSVRSTADDKDSESPSLQQPFSIRALNHALCEYQTTSKAHAHVMQNFVVPWVIPIGMWHDCAVEACHTFSRPGLIMTANGWERWRLIWALMPIYC